MQTEGRASVSLSDRLIIKGVIIICRREGSRSVLQSILNETSTLSSLIFRATACPIFISWAWAETAPSSPKVTYIQILFIISLFYNVYDTHCSFCWAEVVFLLTFLNGSTCGTRIFGMIQPRIADSKHSLHTPAVAEQPLVTVGYSAAPQMSLIAVALHVITQK